jgi:hypothetical protein
MVSKIDIPVKRLQSFLSQYSYFSVYYLLFRSCYRSTHINKSGKPIQMTISLPKHHQPCTLQGKYMIAVATK